MIDHYSLYEISKLTDRYGLDAGIPKSVKPRFNVSPTQKTAVVVDDGGEAELRMMNWGLISQGAKDMNSVFRYKTHNVQSEKVFSKASWDSAIRSRRCIIPVNGFYMIRSGESSDTYYFTHGNESLLSLAGFYSVTQDAEGAKVATFTLLTVESGDAMPLPFARMPVILHSQDESAWIDPNVTDFSSMVRMMRPYEGLPLKYVKISRDITNIKNDMPSLIR